MKIIKFFLIILLLILTLGLFKNTPGYPYLERYHSECYENKNLNLDKKIRCLQNYPIGTQKVFDNLLNASPADEHMQFFYNQSSWLIGKSLIYVCYILVLFLLLKIKKIFNLSISNFDLVLLYLGSGGFLLSYLALSFFQILSFPWFILSLFFLLRKKVFASISFLVFSSMFNWSLLIFLPLFLLPLFGNKKVKKIFLKYFYFFSLTLFLVLFLPISERLKIVLETKSKLLNIFWLFKQPFVYKFERELTRLGVLFFSAFSIFYILSSFFQKQTSGKKKIKTLSILVGLVLALYVLPIHFTGFPQIFFASLFLLTSFLVLRDNLESFASSKQMILRSIFLIFLSYILFFPGSSEGNLALLPLISLIIYIFEPKKKFLYLYVFTNLLSFIFLFMFYDTAGIHPPVRPIYFDFMKRIGSFLMMIIGVNLFFDIKRRNLNTKRLVIYSSVLLLFISTATIPSQGTGDASSYYHPFNVVASRYWNPFLIHTIIKQGYPPLSTFIYTVFTHLFRLISGFSDNSKAIDDYALATRISGYFFYLVSLCAIYYASKKIGKKAAIISVFSFLTLFSIAVQTNGLGDVDIYIVPSFVLSFYFLYKKKYFASGLMYGLSSSIKWQPLVLLPLIGAYTFDLWKDKRKSFINSGRYLLGFLIIPSISWYLIWIQELGPQTLRRDFGFFLNRPLFLSGQAMGLGWIVTYITHVIGKTATPLSELGGVNQFIGANQAPTIFRGQIFYLLAFLIILSVWINKSKKMSLLFFSMIILYLSHHMFNKGAYEGHFFYVVISSFMLYLFYPTAKNRMLLILMDLMSLINQIMFYGFLGKRNFSRLLFGFDITVLFSFVYLFVFFWLFGIFFKKLELYKSFRKLLRFANKHGV